VVLLIRGHLDHLGGSPLSGRRNLFCCGTVFHRGRNLLRGIPDCEVPAYSRTLRRLGYLAIDGLYPGHLMWCQQGGGRHIAKANEYLDRLLLPPNLV
jgi:hypothetical protein